MMDTAPVPPQHEAGLRLIIFYKSAKAAIWIATAAVLVVGLQFGLTNAIRDQLIHLEQRMSYEWAIRAAHWLVQSTTKKNLVYTILVLFLDGVATGFEGWALHHRKQWGEWLVIVTTSSFLPFEVWAIVEGLRKHYSMVPRVTIFVINIAIVIYLVRRLRWQRKEAAAHVAITD